MIQKILLFLFIIMFQVIYSQDNNMIKLANEYYTQGEYAKAETYFKDLYKDYHNVTYIKKYITCLSEQSKYNLAEKTLKKYLKKNPNPSLFIELGKIYKKLNNKKNSYKQFNHAIEHLTANYELITQIANKFKSIKENDYILKTYEKGEELFGDQNAFSSEIANFYGFTKQYDKMIESYLNVLEKNPYYLKNIQNSLSKTMSFEKNNPATEALEKGLLKKIQSNSKNFIFNELLIWINLQQKDFKNAYIQTKALDLQKKENGSRLISLGDLCISNNQFQIAKKCYKIVSQKGKKNKYYTIAQKKKLECEKLTLESKQIENPMTWDTLCSKYIKVLLELGIKNNESLYIQLAKIKAFNVFNYDTAIQILKQLIHQPKIPENILAEAKILLADIYLITDEIWESALLYGQVEKMFKNEPIGEIAKFKFAKIGYFTGDFNWATTQLNILKGSTSKLIANDAMYLSMLITENTYIDTLKKPITMFAKADLYFTQKQYEKCILLLDTIIKEFPNHSISDDIYFLSYKVYKAQKKYTKAVEQLQKIIDTYYYGLLIDEAIFYTAELFDTYILDKEKAKEYYKKILTEHQGSILQIEARKRYRILRGDILN